MTMYNDIAPLPANGETRTQAEMRVGRERTREYEARDELRELAAAKIAEEEEAKMEAEKAAAAERKKLKSVPRSIALAPEAEASAQELPAGGVTTVEVSRPAKPRK